MQWYKIYRKIEKQLQYKNPAKTILYIDVCINCQIHLEEKIFSNTLIAKELYEKATVLNLRKCDQNTLLHEIKSFLSKSNSIKKTLIIFNDDTLYPYDSCLKAFCSLQENLSKYTKSKIKIEIHYFCFYKSPYCYIKKSKLISHIDINEQILLFHRQKICNKKTSQENYVQIKEHENFVVDVLSQRFKKHVSNIRVIYIFDKVENYTQYLEILKQILDYEFLIIYYELEALNSFLEMNNINSIEITNKINFKEIYEIFKSI